jgi:hypothetical protein
MKKRKVLWSIPAADDIAASTFSSFLHLDKMTTEKLRRLQMKKERSTTLAAAVKDVLSLQGVQ